MKSIYQRIGAILIFVFLVQVICVSLIYNQVFVKNIIEQVNVQETNRQSILQEAAIALERYSEDPSKIQDQLNKLTEEYNASFTVKNTNGETVYFSRAKSPSDTDLQEQTSILGNKNSYIIYGTFPAKINKFKPSQAQQSLRILISCVAAIVSIISFWLIYNVVANPLKKLSKAVNQVNYGSTLIEIPYYENDELGLLCRNFEEMGKRLKRSEQNQQELVQAISHDIKTPLTSIMGYSKRLIEGKVKENKFFEYYETIYRKANELKNLLQELDEYASLNTTTRYSMQIVNAEEYFYEICSELKIEAEQSSCILKSIIDLNDTINIKIDKLKLKRVFVNIVQNSIKYAGDDCQIVCSCILKDNKVYFEIEDNGTGVPEEQMERIFDRFYRIDSSRSRDKGWTGLGLSICKDIVHNHNGEIKAENKITGGLKIWFSIPVY